MKVSTTHEQGVIMKVSTTHITRCYHESFYLTYEQGVMMKVSTTHITRCYLESFYHTYEQGVKKTQCINASIHCEIFVAIELLKDTKKLFLNTSIYLLTQVTIHAHVYNFVVP